MSGAVVCVHDVPAVVVTQIPRFVLEPFDESAIDAYTVWSVAYFGEIPISILPTVLVGGSPFDCNANVIEHEVAFVDL